MHKNKDEDLEAKESQKVSFLAFLRTKALVLSSTCSIILNVFLVYKSFFFFRIYYRTIHCHQLFRKVLLEPRGFVNILIWNATFLNAIISCKFWTKKKLLLHKKLFKCIWRFGKSLLWLLSKILFNRGFKFVSRLCHGRLSKT